MHSYVCALWYIYIITSPSFHVSVPFYMSTTYNGTYFKLTAFLCLWFALDCLIDALYSAVVQIFIMALVIYSAHIIHFMNPPMINCPGSHLLCTPWLSGNSWQDLGHLAASNHYHSGGGYNHMEVCPDIQEGCRLHAKWYPHLPHNHHSSLSISLCNNCISSALTSLWTHIAEYRHHTHLCS